MTNLAAIALTWAHLWMPGVSNLSRVATGSLVAAVWQGILLAIAVALGLRLLPRTPAAVRFAIWFTVFAVVTALPMLSLWPHVAAATSSTGHPAWLTLDSRWSLGIAAIWLAASLVRAVTLMVAAARLRALWKRATPIATPIASSPTVIRRAQLCASDEVDRPAVIGFFSPKILIPNWLLEKLTPEELQQIVLHETGHLGRADDWMNLLQKIALVLFPLNPALAWVERRLCFERELAVDERVLHALAGKTGAAKAYAACLATLAEYRLQRRGFTLALGALGRESELGRRVGRILRRSEPMRPLHARLVLGGAMLGLVGAAVGLERIPQVVGFAPVNTTNVASAALARVPGVRQNRAVYRSVEFRTNINQHEMIQRKAYVSHEVLLRASAATPGMPVTAREHPAASHDLPTYTARETLASVKPDHTPAQPASATTTPANPHVVEWVVLTSWQSTDGSHMVLTTASTQDPAGKTSTPAPGSGQQQSSDEVHPYAAVPVRGGWLIFQL